MKAPVPRVHLRPERNWINDPNGLIYANGVIHIFAQYNPKGSTWGSIHWIHYSSSDWITWNEHGIVLSPDQDYDQSGCWSGCTIRKDDTVYLFYSADNGKTRQPALATATINSGSSVLRFVKYGDNPIIKHRPQEGLTGFRDHSVFRWKDQWIQLIGSGDSNRGIIFFYTSGNLINWEFGGLWHVEEHPTGHILECPDLVCFDEESGDSLLIFSTNMAAEEETLQSYWWMGRIMDGNGTPVFHPINTGILDHGVLYAPQMCWENDRVIMVGWIREEEEDTVLQERDWAGMLSLPRELRYENGALRQYPLPELQNLRTASRFIEIYTSPYNGNISLPCELIIKFNPNSLIKTRIELSKDETISYIYHKDHVEVTNSSRRSKPHQHIYSIPYDRTSTVQYLHIFIDISSIESFINYQETVSMRFHTHQTHLGIIMHGNCTMEIHDLRTIHIRGIED